MPGLALFGSGCALLAASVGATPDYVGASLPAALLAGAGIGLTFAAFGSAAVAELPPARFPTGGTESRTCRQIGAALGVAAFVALCGTSARADALEASTAAGGR